YTIPDGCIAVASVLVNPLPVISAGSDVAICKGDNTPLTATGGDTYSWSPAEGLSCTTCSNPVATPTITTTYTVTGAMLAAPVITYNQSFIGGADPTTAECNAWD